MSESEIRSLRNRVFDHRISDMAWNSVRQHWMQPHEIAWLRAHDFPLSTPHSPGISSGASTMKLEARNPITVVNAKGNTSLWLAMVLMCIGFSCTSTNRTAYQVTATTVVTVDAAMEAWGTWVGKNHPGAEKEQKVANAYSKYQASVNTVADAAIAFSKAKAASDPALPAVQANFNAAISASAAALSDLEGLIVSFGIKL